MSGYREIKWTTNENCSSFVTNAHLSASFYGSVGSTGKEIIKTEMTRLNEELDI